MALSTDGNRRLQRILDVPNCGCKLKNKPLCQHDNPQGCEGPRCIKKKQPLGCEQRVKTGKCACRAKECECPTVPGPPCEHVLAAGKSFPNTLSFDEWQELMTGASPESYAEPPEPTVAEQTLNREAKAAAMEERDRDGLSLRHRRDLGPDDLEQFVLQAATRGNGSIPARLQIVVTQGGSVDSPGSDRTHDRKPG